MIEIKNEFTLDEIVNANYVLRKKYLILSLILFVTGIIGIVPMFLLVIYNDNFIYTLLLGLSAFLLIFFGYLSFTLRRSSLRNRILKLNPSLKDGMEYTYIFDNDEFTLTQRLTTSVSNDKIKYIALKKVVINKEYIYLYLSQYQVFPIKLKSVNDLDELKRLLHV
ncbi:MAG: YcxB family protein [Acholeplasmatales bacterium]|nr:YcxB family protein [Acholeplasmatales bacterium]